MKYWLIAIAIIIIIACLIYYNNTVIEGLGENQMTKYYEDTSRIDNILQMIHMKITELRMKLTDTYATMLTPDNLPILEEQHKIALNNLTQIQTKMDKKNGSVVRLTPEQKKEEQSKLDTLNQTIDDISNAKSIIRYQLQQDFLNNAKKIIANQYDIYYFKNKRILIQKELNNLWKQDKSKKRNKKIKEKQADKRSYNRNIQLAKANIKKLKDENNAKLETDAGLEEGSKVYLPLQNIIDGKSQSSDPATTYNIPVDDDGNIDPTQFYDYIDDDAAKVATDENKGTWVKDKDGNMIQLDLGDITKTDVNYYSPGTYTYDSGIYVPSYQDSVYLSKTTGKHTAAEYLDMASLAGGICSHYKDQPEKLEEECAKLDKNICGSTSCCVLLGGSKCVSGTAQGPTSNLNYGDITIRNRDFYYYKGKCYGNCVSQSTTSTDADTDIVVDAKTDETASNTNTNNDTDTDTKV